MLKKPNRRRTKTSSVWSRWLATCGLMVSIGCASLPPAAQHGRAVDMMKSGSARSRDSGSTKATTGVFAQPAPAPYRNPFLPFGLANRTRQSQPQRIPQNQAARPPAQTRQLPNPQLIAQQQEMPPTAWKDQNVAQASFEEPDSMGIASSGNALRDTGNVLPGYDPSMEGIQDSTGHFDQGSSILGSELQFRGRPATQVALQLTEEKAALEAELRRMNQINADLTARLDNSSRDLSEANGRISQLQSDLAKQLAKNDQLKSEVDVLKLEKANLVEQSRMLVAAIEKTLDEILFNQLSASSSGGN